MSVKSITIRPLDFERDVEAYACLRSLNEYAAIPAQVYRDREAAMPASSEKFRIVAEVDRVIAGLGMWIRHAFNPPGTAWMVVCVKPEFERLGIGSRLHDAVLDQLSTTSIRLLTSDFPETRAHVGRFAAERGWKETGKAFESNLDLDRLDPDLEHLAKTTVQAHRLRYEVLSPADRHDPFLPTLYELYHEADSDEPYSAVVGVPSFELFANRFDSEVFQAGFSVVIFDGAVPVSFAQVIRHDNGHMYNEFTGTSRSWRGKKLALAAKSLALAEAKRRGGGRITTHNMSSNAPMLAINARLGYVPDYGWIAIEKEIKQ